MTCSECELPVKAKGLCARHYQRLRRNGDLDVSPVIGRRNRTFPPKPTCSIEGCERPHTGHGLCQMHRRRQEPTYTLRATVQERFDRQWQPDDDGCWMWTGSLSWGGYGRMKVNGKLRIAARLAWELYRGPIPAGLTIDHLCRRPACVNPDHLEPVPLAENLRRRKF